MTSNRSPHPPHTPRPTRPQLLEEETTLARLAAVQELLSGTAKYLSAQVALQGAFKTTGGGSSGSGGEDASVPPPGGPD